VKLITEGILPNNIIYRGECHYCHSIMEAKQKELTVSVQWNETNYYAKCLLCKRSVSFIEKQIKPKPPPKPI